MEFGILGPLEVTAAPGGPVALGGARARALLAVLRLRKALGDGEMVQTTPAGYRLRVLPGELDAEHFDELVDSGRRALADGDPQLAASLLRQAPALWRGPPLSDLP